MTEELQQILVPAGIGLIATGIIFALTVSPFFFLLSGAGLALALFSVYYNPD